MPHAEPACQPLVQVVDPQRFSPHPKSRQARQASNFSLNARTGARRFPPRKTFGKLSIGLVQRLRGFTSRNRAKFTVARRRSPSSRRACSASPAAKASRISPVSSRILSKTPWASGPIETHRRGRVPESPRRRRKGLCRNRSCRSFFKTARWGGNSSCLVQGDQEDFWRHSCPNRDARQTHASRYQHRTTRSFAQAARVFPPIARGKHRRPPLRQPYLAAVRVPAQHQIDPIRFFCEFCCIRIVREHYPRHIRSTPFSADSRRRCLPTDRPPPPCTTHPRRPTFPKGPRPSKNGAHYPTTVHRPGKTRARHASAPSQCS